MANHYYSGQGRVYYGTRILDANGISIPSYLEELGNCPNLDISIEISKFEHKESQSGSRATDVTIVQEKKGTFTMTLESMTMENLALAFWGTQTNNAAVTSGQITVPLTASVSATAGVYRRIPMGLGIVGVSNVVIGSDLTPTITYEFGTTVDDVASKNGYIDEKNGVIVIFDSGTQTTKAATNPLTDTTPIYVQSYDQVATQSVAAFTQTSQQKYLRFEGLNTIDNGGGGNKSVIVDIFKADLDPLSGYGLINEEIGTFEITGSVLLDDTQPAGNQFFNQTNVS